MKYTRNICFHRQFPVLLFVFIFLFASCKPDEPATPGPPATDYLVEGTFVNELSKETISQQAAILSPVLSGMVQHGALLYKITYKTTNTDGQEILASGAMAIPKTAGTEFPLLSVQHGTIFSDESAPSNFNEGSEMTLYGSLFAALGYIAVFPDYIGYGASREYPHPYEHRSSLASASLDMLRAVKEFLTLNEEFKWNKKLFISGFSEGGYATLSLQKKIEEEAASEFNLVASSCGAGAYNKTAFMQHLVNNPTHGNVGYNRSYLWVLLTYNSVYGLNKPMSYYFKEPYATQIAQQQQQASIPVSFHTIFNDSFIESLNGNTDEAFRAAVADNDLLDWKPVTPTQLYHGTDDELVYYFNSETAYEAMKAKGATAVELKALPGKNHTTALNDYLFGTYSFFISKQ